jgi:hypothetical protein
MERIPQERIEKLAARKGVKVEAVRNFLGTAHHCGTLPDALMNLNMDARLYGWNQKTINAIRDGLLDLD